MAKELLALAHACADEAFFTDNVSQIFTHKVMS